jgi:hypothetical protein
MSCYPTSANNSIAMVGNLWLGKVFIPANGGVPWYTYNGDCNVFVSDSAPIVYRDFFLPCTPFGCVFGYEDAYGVRNAGGWGLCGPPPSAYCNIADSFNLFVNDEIMDPSHFILRQTAVHEAGHPVALGDIYTPCPSTNRSIMMYDCVFYYGEHEPGPHDGVDIQAIY